MLHTERESIKKEIYPLKGEEKDYSILLFDSGIGGLGVLEELRLLMPHHSFIYVADNAGFPYGAQEESTLNTRILYLIGRLIECYNPEIIVLPCNTASTLSLTNLRVSYPFVHFVGTVPAIKPAAERTHSGLISVVGTPRTIRSPYTHDLIQKWAPHCQVNCVESGYLASLAENYMRYQTLDKEILKQEIIPCFIEQKEGRTDIIVLACTHYPFLVSYMEKLAPWPVYWLHPAKAIANRVLSISSSSGVLEKKEKNKKSDIAVFTSSQTDNSLQDVMKKYKFTLSTTSFE